MGTANSKVSMFSKRTARGRCSTTYSKGTEKKKTGTCKTTIQSNKTFTKTIFSRGKIRKKKNVKTTDLYESIANHKQTRCALQFTNTVNYTCNGCFSDSSANNFALLVRDLVTAVEFSLLFKCNDTAFLKFLPIGSLELVSFG